MNNSDFILIRNYLMGISNSLNPNSRDDNATFFHLKKHVDILSGTQYTCTRCGETVTIGKYCTDLTAEMIHRLACFNCNYWLAAIDRRFSANQVRVNGVLYHIGNEPTPSTPLHCCGYGGSKFRITFTDGRDFNRVVTTQNLWHNGTIPERFRELLPDNAEMENL